MKYCSNCGKELDDGVKFCPGCGLSVEGTPNIAVEAENTQAETVSDGRYRRSYIVSVITAIITFFIRVGGQDTYIYWDNLLDNRKVLGLSEDSKPFITLIPVAATIIVSLLIVSDKQTDAQRKRKAFIINAIFILLSLLFIWMDIPSKILDF